AVRIDHEDVRHAGLAYEPRLDVGDLAPVRAPRREPSFGVDVADTTPAASILIDDVHKSAGHVQDLVPYLDPDRVAGLSTRRDHPRPAATRLGSHQPRRVHGGDARIETHPRDLRARDLEVAGIPDDRGDPCRVAFADPERVRAQDDARV